jgi:hypothetical protein
MKMVMIVPYLYKNWNRSNVLLEGLFTCTGCD